MWSDFVKATCMNTMPKFTTEGDILCFFFNFNTFFGEEKIDDTRRIYFIASVNRFVLDVI